jgi:hypothetical protein
MKYQVNIQTSHHFTVRDPKPFRVTMQFASERSSTHSWIFKERESRDVRNSRLAVDATWLPCPSPRQHARAREDREGRGGRSRRTCRARAMSNQAFVDVIIARKRAPSHRVFVAQVFGRNMCGKRRRHRFSAFWLRSSVKFLDQISTYWYILHIKLKLKICFTLLLYLNLCYLTLYKVIWFIWFIFLLIWCGLAIICWIQFLVYNFQSAGRILLKFAVWIVIFVPVLLH